MRNYISLTFRKNSEIHESTIENAPD